jgi:hypothetical protein
MLLSLTYEASSVKSQQLHLASQARRNKRRTPVPAAAAAAAAATAAEPSASCKLVAAALESGCRACIICMCKQESLTAAVQVYRYLCRGVCRIRRSHTLMH